MAPFLGIRRATRGIGLAILAAAALSVIGGSPALAASGSGGSGGSGGGGGTAGFALSANYQPPFFVGHLIRGGLLSCSGCTTSIEPRYRVTGFTPGWDSNSLAFVSLNGFSGTVTLAVSGLPLGVTSQTATSVTVPRGGAVSTPLRLQAAAFAATGTATVTVRASAGGIVRSLLLPISVGDGLRTS